MPFNENHKRYLLSTFEHIDRLLAQAVANLDGETNSGAQSRA